MTAAQGGRPGTSHGAGTGAERLARELREPLLALSAAADVLGGGGGQPDLKLDEQPAEAVRAWAVWLQSLVEHELSVAAVRAGRMRLQLWPVDLLALVGEVTAVLRPALAQRLHTLRLDASVPGTPVDADPSGTPTSTGTAAGTDAAVFADPRWIAQVVISLIVHVSRSAPPATEIAVTAGVHGSWVRVGVAGAARGSGRRWPPAVRAIVEAHRGRSGAGADSTGRRLAWFELPRLPSGRDRTPPAR